MINPVKQMVRIGDLARLGKVTPRTVRYYEGLGLIPPGEREGTGQHRYPEQTVARLQKIDQLKALGLNLEGIGKLIHLYFEDPTGRRAKIKVLEMLRTHLPRWKSSCAVYISDGSSVQKVPSSPSNELSQKQSPPAQQ